MLSCYEATIVNTTSKIQENIDKLQESKKEAFYNKLYW